MAPHSNTLAWKIPWMEEPGGLQFMGSEESDTTEQLPFLSSLSCIGEGNGNPLQCSCLENPRDGGAWWASVYGVAQSRTRLKRLSSSKTSLALPNSHNYCHRSWPIITCHRMAAEKGQLGKAPTLLNYSSWHTTGCVPPGVAKSLAQSFTILTADSSILWLPILWIFSEEGSKLSLHKCDDETTGGSLAPRMKLKTCNLAFEAPPPPNLSSSGWAPHPRGPSLPWLWDVYSISLCLPDSLRPKSSLPSSTALRKNLKNPFFHPCIPRHSASAAEDAVTAETGARLGTTPAHVRTRVTSALTPKPPRSSGRRPRPTHRS